MKKARVQNKLFQSASFFQSASLLMCFCSNGIGQFSTLKNQSERQAIELFFNLYKHSVLFAGHMQTTQTQIRHHRG